MCNEKKSEPISIESDLFQGFRSHLDLTLEETLQTRYVIVSDGVTTICEICDSREVRKLASRLERELLKARRERMTENGGAQSQRPASEPVCETV